MIVLTSYLEYLVFGSEDWFFSKILWNLTYSVNRYILLHVLADELFECVWPFCGVGTEGVNMMRCF